MSAISPRRVSLDPAEARTLYQIECEAGRARRAAKQAAVWAQVRAALAELEARRPPKRGGKRKIQIVVGKNIEDPRDIPSRHWRNGER